MAISPYVRDLRAVVGGARLLLASVSGVVRDSRGGVLLVRQRDTGRWTTPGGVIELNEVPADAVVREVWEETGVEVRPVRVLGVYGGPGFVVTYPNGDQSQYISVIFECEVISGTPRPDNEETSAVRFVTLDEAHTLSLEPWLRPVLPRLFDPSAETWFEAPSWAAEHSSESART